MRFKNVCLEDIASITMGQSPKSEYYNNDGLGLPFLQGNRTFGRKFPTFDTYTTFTTKLAYAGDVIMSVRAPVGDLNITPVDMCLGRGVCSLRMNNGEQEFLFYLLKHSIGALINRANGTIFSSIGYKDLAKTEVCVPIDAADQSRIGSFFKLIDDKIELDTRISIYLDELACAYLENCCSQRNVPNARLADVARITMGQSPAGTSFNEDGNGAVFYQGRRDFGDWFPRRRLFTTEPNRMALEGDTLLSVRAPVGDTNVANEDCCIGRGLAAIHSEYPSLVFFLLKNMSAQFDKFNGDGTVFGSINRKALNELPIWLPEKDEIIRIESFLRPISDIIRRNDDEIQALEELQSILLTRVFSGDSSFDDLLP